MINGNRDMTYSLDNFCEDTRTILSEGDDSDGRAKVKQKLEQLLTDQAFCAEYAGAENKTGMSQIFEDPKLHFCVLAYNMEKPRTSPPHDHGRSWAIYGQVAGYTDMTIWESEDGADNLVQARSFRLEPGQAGLFDTREVHSIDYPAGSKFIRVTGVDMSKEARRVFDPVSGAVKVVESVGTGSRA
ncbi:MAG: putative metal-dependent enzyme (double-stranded beta helix superfamily) [Candidatus Azotimanducaceae bacterium]|jgi:predicted metal-dependent enzyme (double-stranded beta helix superfamily)